MARGFRGGKRRADAVEELIRRDGDWCWYCGFTFDFGERAQTIDHVVLVSRGGRNNLENLRLACSYCNLRRARVPDGQYEASDLLAARRRLAHREAMLTAGAWLPKRAFHHSRIRWLAKERWICDACGQGANDGAPRVPCGRWVNTPPTSWVRWWYWYPRSSAGQGRP